MAKIAGTAYVKIDGQQVALRGNLKIGAGSIQRESIVGLDGYHGIKEIPMASSIEFDVTDRPEVDLNKLEKLENVTVTVELISGKIVTLRNASQMNKLELSADDGQFTLKFEGPAGEYSVR